MLEIIKQNISTDKEGLYRTLANKCGVKRVGCAITDYFDQVLKTIASDIKIEGNQIFLQ